MADDLGVFAQEAEVSAHGAADGGVGEAGVDAEYAEVVELLGEPGVEAGAW